MCHLFSCFVCLLRQKSVNLWQINNVKAMSVKHLNTLETTGKMSDNQTELNII